MPGVRRVKIRPRNAGDFRIISKLVQRVCSYLRDPKVFQFERVLPDGFSNDEDIFFQWHPQLLGYAMPLTVTFPRDHSKPKVIPTEGWHGKEVVGSDEGEGSATDGICEHSENRVLYAVTLG